MTYTLTPDEKTMAVMVYTQHSLVRGELVTKKNVLRINIWLRTEGAPKYMHILNPHVLVFGGSPVKSHSFPEIYFPTAQAIAFHTVPPTDEVLDYDPNEVNRMMQPMEILVGTFLVKGRIRISTQTEVGASLEVARVAWMSIYDAVISNPYLPQMPHLQVPMLLVNPNAVSFGM